ncbi:vitronectin [Tamandua tetradactyla]|uniref:vitronectin n=1 Tax=Tamandua tetradactyla TaxID=48850 RepID=UPI004054499E
MAPPGPLLMLVLLAPVVLADQESCKGRCTEGFNAERKCQCDDLCSYYQSCCTDYDTECKPQVTRGDVFTLPEDEYGNYDYTGETKNASIQAQSVNASGSSSTSPDLQAQPEGNSEQSPIQNPEGMSPQPTQWGPPVSTASLQGLSGPLADDELCSGKPFDAFTDIKNGSIFAFRGRYFYELDENGVRPGDPKLIQDVWGIEGPIDAAFTRINCQGKTYLFQGSQYWRFNDGVLDPNYPRNISEGFKGIPDNVDAAFALPAHSYHGREQVYFFKGKQYWEYQFHEQPSQVDCEDSSPSVVFEHFVLLQRDSWENIFELLFWSRSSGGTRPPHLISQDWPGVPKQVDAAMAGRMYISGLPTLSSWAQKHKTRRRSRKRYRSHRGRSRSRSQTPSRPSRSLWLSWFSNEESGLGDSTDTPGMDWLVPASCEPIQSVYFFSEDKYYRVNLRTRQVDTVDPPYPRSIAQYWLKCPTPGLK